MVAYRPPMAYTREQLEACRGAEVPDLIGPDCHLLIVGINPGLQTAMTGLHFAHPSNRFWPAMRLAGLIDWVPDVSPLAPAVPQGPSGEEKQGSRGSSTAATNTHFRHPRNPSYPVLRLGVLIDRQLETSAGMIDQQRADLQEKGIGITNLVNRATARADELNTAELILGGQRLANWVAEVSPEVVAIAGVTAYRTAFSRPKALLGEQPEELSGSRLWVIPNPSGLNAHVTTADMANWMSQLSDAAGLR